MSNNFFKTGFSGILIGITLPVMLTLTSVVYATGNGSPAECDNPTATISNNENLLTFTAPAGNIVDGVCIHSGTNMFGGNQHSSILGNGTYENGCYTVSGVGTQTVTVQRVGPDSSSCQALSHIDVIDGAVTASPSPLVSSTPAPTTTTTPVPTATPAAVPTTTPTSTPSAAPAATSTPTSTPLPSSATTPSDSSSSVSNSSTNSDSGAVLAASASNPALDGAVLGASAELPATGTSLFWPVFGITSLISGTGLVGLGLKRKNS